MLRYLLPSGANGSRLHPQIARLVRFWAAFIGVLLTGALVLQVLGPPRHRTAAPIQLTPMGLGEQAAKAVPPQHVPATRAEPEAPGPSAPERAAAALPPAADTAQPHHDVTPEPGSSAPERATAALPPPAADTAQPRHDVTPESGPSAPERTAAAPPPPLADAAQSHHDVTAEPGPSGLPAETKPDASPSMAPSAAMPADSSPATTTSAHPSPANTQGMATALIQQPQVGEPAATRVEEPEMIAIAAGTFRMGSREDATEEPIHAVTVKPFLMAKYPVTVKQWNACVAAKACAHVADGDDDAPISNVSWTDAQQFVAWLSQASHEHYRLPSEAEWEYAARGGTETRYWWGNTMKAGLVNCKGCGGPQVGLQPARVGTLPPNPFGLYDIGGGIEEWVEDCWHKDYRGATVDGSAWLAGDCHEHVLRGGSWRGDPSDVRSASRNFYDATVRYPAHGLRLARSL